MIQCLRREESFGMLCVASNCLSSSDVSSPEDGTLLSVCCGLLEQ